MRALPAACTFALLLTTAACDVAVGPPSGTAAAAPQLVTADEAASLANANAAALADGMANKVSFFSKSEALKGSSQPCAAPLPGEPTPGDGCSEQGGFDAAKAAAEFKDWLGKNMLNKQFAAPSLSTATEAVFCLSAKAACKTTDEFGKTGIDAKCAQGLAEVPVCVALSKIGAKSMTGKILVGKPPALVPATFSLDPDHFTGKVDLAILRQAALAFATATGEKLPEDFPQIAAGGVSVALVRKTDLSFDATLNIDSFVHVGALTKTDKHFYDIKLAQTTAAVVLHIGKKDKAIFGSLGLNALEVGVAMELLLGNGGECAPIAVPPGGDPGLPPPEGECPPPTDYKGLFFLKLADIGVNADYAMSADDKLETILLSGVTLGPDTAHLKFDDGATVSEIASADLNKAAARKADLAITVTDGKCEVAVTKLLELVVIHDLEVVGKQIDDLSKAFYHGSSQVRLDGSAQPKVAFIQQKNTTVPNPKDGGDPPAPEPAPTPDVFLHVLDGKLLLQATGLLDVGAINVEVAAGQCLVQKPKAAGEKGAAPHPFAMMQPGVCP